MKSYVRYVASCGAVVAAATTVACGTGSTTSALRSGGTAPSTSAAQLQPSQGVEGPSDQPVIGHEGPVINWDSPFPEGTDVPDVATARAKGMLAFTPIVPAFNVAPVRIQVENPRFWHSVVFVFHFPVGKVFPTDGRVTVTETEPDLSNQDILDVIKNPPGPPGDFDIISLGGQQALLIHASGVGRIRFVSNNVDYDIKGPAVSPTEVVKLANQLVSSR